MISLRRLLAITGQRVRLISRDEDIVTRPNELPGEKTIVKLRGDLWTEDPAFSTEHLQKRMEANPGLRRLVSRWIHEGPVVFYGFSIIDPVFELFSRVFGPLPGTTIVATRIDNSLWRQQCRTLGLHGIDAATWSDVERKIITMCEAISPATSLPDVSALTEEVGEVVSRHLATNPLLVWAHRPGMRSKRFQLRKFQPSKSLFALCHL